MEALGNAELGQSRPFLPTNISKDYDTAWTSAGCLNTPPLPYNNINDRPNYSTQVGSESALSMDEDLRYMSTSQSNSFNSRSLNVARRHTVVRYVAMAVHF